MLFQMKTTLSENETHTIEFFSIGFEPFGLLAPTGTYDFIYVLGEFGLMQMLVS